MGSKMSAWRNLVPLEEKRAHLDEREVQVDEARPHFKKEREHAFKLEESKVFWNIKN